MSTRNWETKTRKHVVIGEKAWYWRKVQEKWQEILLLATVKRGYGIFKKEYWVRRKRYFRVAQVYQPQDLFDIVKPWCSARNPNPNLKETMNETLTNWHFLWKKWVVGGGLLVWIYHNYLPISNSRLWIWT